MNSSELINSTHERDKWSECGPFFCAIESDT